MFPGSFDDDVGYHGRFEKRLRDPGSVIAEALHLEWVVTHAVLGDHVHLYGTPAPITIPARAEYHSTARRWSG